MMSQKSVIVFLAVLVFSLSITSCDGGKQKVKPTDVLPQNGIYSESEGTGGNYQDPIHRFFQVKPPPGYAIKEKRDRTTTLDGGSSRGKIVPCTRTDFKSGKNTIGVVTRKTYHSVIEDNIKVVERNYRSAGVKIDRTRFITIDGVKGAEILAKAAPYQLLLIKYNKDGLDHAITISCSPRDFATFSEDFLPFLQSYRSVGTE